MKLSPCSPVLPPPAARQNPHEACKEGWHGSLPSLCYYIRLPEKFKTPKLPRFPSLMRCRSALTVSLSTPSLITATLCLRCCSTVAASSTEPGISISSPTFLVLSTAQFTKCASRVHLLAFVPVRMAPSGELCRLCYQLNNTQMHKHTDFYFFIVQKSW